MANNCLVTKLPGLAPAGFAGPVYAPPETTILARSSLRFWGDGSTMVTAGTPITAFNSKGGLAAGYVQTLANNQPSYVANGNPAVIGGEPYAFFDGNTASPGNLRDYMIQNGSLANLDMTQPYSFVVVFRPDDLATVSFLFGTTGGGDNQVALYSGGAALSFTHGDTATRIQAPTTQAVWTAVACGWNGTRQTIVSGGVRATGAPAINPTGTLAIPIGTRSDVTPNTTRFTGAIASWMYFAGEDITDSPAFWQTVRDYIHGRFGLSSNPLVA
jgi:hypothetical protein